MKHQIIDDFKLETGGVLDNTLLVRIELPKFQLKPSINKKQVIEKHSLLLLTFLRDPIIYKQIFMAARKNLPEFKIKFFSKKKLVSTWNLLQATINTVDLGFIDASEEEKGVLQCEIDYKNIDVDGIIL